MPVKGFIVQAPAFCPKFFQTLGPQRKILRGVVTRNIQWEKDGRWQHSSW